jgi:hypothetical protein
MGTVLRERSCHFGSARTWMAGSAIRMRLSDNMNCQLSLYSRKGVELNPKVTERWGGEEEEEGGPKRPQVIA